MFAIPTIHTHVYKISIHSQIYQQQQQQRMCKAVTSSFPQLILPLGTQILYSFQIYCINSSKRGVIKIHRQIRKLCIYEQLPQNPFAGVSSLRFVFTYKSNFSLISSPFFFWAEFCLFLFFFSCIIRT